MLWCAGLSRLFLVGEIPAREKGKPPYPKSSLGPVKVTTRAKRRQSDVQAVTQVKQLSLVIRPRADGVEFPEGNSRFPLMARKSETSAGSESTA